MIKFSGNSWVEYIVLPKSLQTNFEELWRMHPKDFQIIKVYGKEHLTPRWQQAYGVDYKFSGKVSKSIPIPKKLQKYIDYFSKRYKRQFNMLLLNWYENGEHYISMHSDDEKCIVPGSEVVTISFGASRRFIVQDKQTKEKLEFDFKNNEALIMGGEFQKTHKHGIPKEKKVVNRRISITLREIKISS